MNWRDLAQLGGFGGVGHLGKYAKTCQLRHAIPQIGPQVVHQANPDSDTSYTHKSHFFVMNENIIFCTRYYLSHM